MGLIDALALRAAGIAGSAQQGRIKGEQERYDRGVTETARQDALKRQALQQALLERNQTADETYRRDALEQQAALRREALAQSEALARQAAADRAAAAADQRTWMGEQKEADRQSRADLVRLTASLRPAGGQEKPKQLPASAVKGIAEWRGLGDATDAAIDAFKDPKTSATGFFQGRVAGLAGQLGMADPKAISARSKLANIATALGKLRSGAAITPSEFERLAPLIPTANDDEDTVRAKLSDLKAYLDQTISRNIETYGETGYDVNGLRGGGVGSDGTGFDPAAELARIRANRKPK